MPRLHHYLPLLALLAVGSCDPYGEDNALGNLTIRTATSGTPDADGYSLAVEGQEVRAMNSTDTTTYVGLPIGNYDITLSDVEPGCSVADGATRTVYLPYGAKSVDLFIVCP